MSICNIPALVICLTVLTLVSCAPPRAYDTEIRSARDLLERYNARARQVERLWARAVVEARWKDENGRRRSEQGDGILVFRKPDQFALTLGKLGNTWYLLGCNPERFWWFDLNPQDDRPNTAYIGRHEDVDGAGTASQVLVPPKQLIELLGITELPAAAEQVAVAPMRGRERTAVTFRIPVQFAGRPATQEVRIGAVTNHPLEIQFTDDQGRVLARSELSEYKYIPPLGQWPAVPTRIAVMIPDRDAELKIVLESLASDPQRFSDALFDLEALVRHYRPDEIRTLQPADSSRVSMPDAAP